MISDKSGASFFWNTGRICYSANDPLGPDQQGKFSTFPNKGWPESGIFYQSTIKILQWISQLLAQEEQLYPTNDCSLSDDIYFVELLVPKCL